MDAAAANVKPERSDNVYVKVTVTKDMDMQATALVCLVDTDSTRACPGQELHQAPGHVLYTLRGCEKWKGESPKVKAPAIPLKRLDVEQTSRMTLH